jgi:hypothetical protein
LLDFALTLRVERPAFFETAPGGILNAILLIMIICSICFVLKAYRDSQAADSLSL